MTYYIDLFSPDTHEIFTKSDRTISGFRERQRGIASTIQPGDKLICYVTKLSRWVGVLEVISPSFTDSKPIFQVNDPFIVRFSVKASVWLPLEKAIPIYNEVCWNNLSFTKNLPQNSRRWTMMIRGSLRKLDNSDGQYIEKMLLNQLNGSTEYPLSDEEKKKLKTHKVKTQDNKQVAISIPQNEEIIPKLQQESIRDSIKIQSLLAEIGERMGFKIWLPNSDRQRVLEIWQPKVAENLLKTLPLNYEDATLKTIENIDMLWIKGRSIARAFEVEHTTSIYSGILRMADLMALQPNLKIKTHIVAPIERKGKVLEEIARPVFAFLENGPLSESCSFLSYDTITELSKVKLLEHMNDSVLEEYAEYAEEADI